MILVGVKVYREVDLVIRLDDCWRAVFEISNKTFEGKNENVRSKKYVFFFLEIHSNYVEVQVFHFNNAQVIIFSKAQLSTPASYSCKMDGLKVIHRI